MIDRFVLNVIYDRFNTAVFPMSLCLLRFSLTLVGRFEQLRVRTHWTDRICLALPKISTKFVSAKSVSAHWDTAKYLLITRVNHETRASIATFEELSDLPNIAGAVDGTHKKIRLQKKVLSTTLADINWTVLGPGDAAGTWTWEP